jgi:lysophospholipase L1-like esterase
MMNPSMRTIHKMKLTYIIGILLFVHVGGYGQATVDFTYKTFSLENEGANKIQNAIYLDDFFNELLQLKVKGKGKINIIHIGDSHIQGDYLTDVVRRNFQHDFGNAGRGLIVPYRIAGTNEPANFRTASSAPWKSKRCTYPNQPLPIGIGGLTIATDQPDADFSIRVNNSAQSNYSFNAVTLFFQKDSTSFHFAIRDTSNAELAHIGPYPDGPFVNSSRALLPHAVDQISIRTIKSNEKQHQATIFGVNLENGQNGMLYHAIGVNGAKYIHYNAAIHFARQTQALHPSVFIISLGTNEAADYPAVDRLIPQHIDKLVQALSLFNPQAKFILVTPPDSFRRKIKPNPGIETVRNYIIQYAVENGLAFWDMYKATGGKDSATQWKNKGLLRPDGIHFSKDGYAYQGDLFYNAIMKSYNNYVSLRHP